jgi:hypothetical protein
MLEILTKPSYSNQSNYDKYGTPSPFVHTVYIYVVSKLFTITGSVEHRTKQQTYFISNLEV